MFLALVFSSKTVELKLDNTKLGCDGDSRKNVPTFFRTENVNRPCKCQSKKLYDELLNVDFYILFVITARSLIKESEFQENETMKTLK